MENGAQHYGRVTNGRQQLCFYVNRFSGIVDKPDVRLTEDQMIRRVAIENIKILGKAYTKGFAVPIDSRIEIEHVVEGGWEDGEYIEYDVEIEMLSQKFLEEHPYLPDIKLEFLNNCLNANLLNGYGGEYFNAVVGSIWDAKGCFWFDLLHWQKKHKGDDSFTALFECIAGCNPDFMVRPMLENSLWPRLASVSDSLRFVQQVPFMDLISEYCRLKGVKLYPLSVEGYNKYIQDNTTPVVVSSKKTNFLK